MYEALHEEALKRVKEFIKSTTELLTILEKIDNAKAYIPLGYESLWGYVTLGLKLSESHAQQFISVMRKSLEVPALKEAVTTGEISLPKAALIVKELTHTNQTMWLENAKTLTTRNLKAEIAKANPLAIPRERITAKTEDISELKLGLKKEVLEQLKHVQDILSQKKRRTITLSEAIEETTEFYLNKNCPLKKAERALCARKVKVTPIKKGRVTHPVWVKIKYI